MKKKDNLGKLGMHKVTLILLCLASLMIASMATPTVLAQSRQGEAYLGVWVLYDEECLPLSDPMGELEQISWALDVFRNDYSINYAVCFYETWESNFAWDSNDTETNVVTLLEEAERESGWSDNINGMFKFGYWMLSNGDIWPETNWVNVLFVITGQIGDWLYEDGYADEANNAFIVTQSACWQAPVEEIGHLYLGGGHCGHFSWNPQHFGYCYMNYHHAISFLSSCDTHMGQSAMHYTWNAPIWDIDEDARTSILDLTIVSFAYGSRPGYPNWDPRADLDGNNFVDMRDLGLVSQNMPDEYLA